jgi:hypothetical protein
MTSRKNILPLVFVLLMFGLVACSTTATRRMVINPNVGVGKIQKGMSKPEVNAVLGKPDSDDGQIWRYNRLGLWVLFGKDSIMFNIHCREPFQGATKEGIGIGSTRAELLATFGEPTQIKEMEGGESIWYSKSKISYWLERGKIVRIVVHLDVR